MTELQEKVCALIADELEVPLEFVTPATRFREDLSLDEGDLLGLQMALDMEMDVAADWDNAPALVTVADAIALIEKAVSE